jgi:hypothetical protein
MTRYAQSSIARSNCKHVYAHKPWENRPNLNSGVWEKSNSRGQLVGKTVGNRPQLFPICRFPRTLVRKVNLFFGWSGERGSNPRPQLWELADTRPQSSRIVRSLACPMPKGPAECTHVHILPWENRGNVGKSCGHSGPSVVEELGSLMFVSPRIVGKSCGQGNPPINP